MAAFAFTLDGQDFARSLWSGKGPAIPSGQVSVSQSDYNTVQSAGLRFKGSPDLRWKYIAGNLQEQTDGRPTGSWSSTQVDLDVGDPAGQVTLTLSTQPSGSSIVEFNSGHKLRLNFVFGVATVDIPTSIPFETRLSTSPTIRLTNQLRVRVLGDDLYPIV